MQVFRLVVHELVLRDASGRASVADATAGGGSAAVSDDQVYVDLEELDAKDAAGTSLTSRAHEYVVIQR